MENGLGEVAEEACMHLYYVSRLPTAANRRSRIKYNAGQSLLPSLTFVQHVLALLENFARGRCEQRTVAKEGTVHAQLRFSFSVAIVIEYASALSISLLHLYFTFLSFFSLFYSLSGCRLRQISTLVRLMRGWLKKVQRSILSRSPFIFSNGSLLPCFRNSPYIEERCIAQVPCSALLHVWLGWLYFVSVCVCAGVGGFSAWHQRGMNHVQVLCTCHLCRTNMQVDSLLAVLGITGIKSYFLKTKSKTERCPN